MQEGDSHIHNLLRRIQDDGDEELHAAAREAMREYHAEAMARRNAAHVTVLRAHLRTRLRALIADARRDGRM